LNTIEEKGISLNDACLIFNIPSKSIILNWQRKYAKEGLAGLKSKPKEDQDL
jgi:transposase